MEGRSSLLLRNSLQRQFLADKFPANAHLTHLPTAAQVEFDKQEIERAALEVKKRPKVRSVS
jgi:hypothetical protein